MMATLNGPNFDYAGNWFRNSPSLAVALNCGIGSSFLKALVNALDKLPIVRPENSSYYGSKYSPRGKKALDFRLIRNPEREMRPLHPQSWESYIRG
jgi:hypothetical protein